MPMPVPEHISVAERFAASVRRSRGEVPIYAIGDRRVRVDSDLTPALDRTLIAAAQVLRVEIKYTVRSSIEFTVEILP